MKAIVREYIHEEWIADKPCCHPMDMALHYKDIKVKQKTIEKLTKDGYKKIYILAFYLGEQEIDCCPFCRKIIEKEKPKK